MTLYNIQCIADALDKFFPANLFLVSEAGKIRWANKRLIQCSGFSGLKEIRGKHVSMFGKTEWCRTKKVAASKKSETSYENSQDKDFITIKTPYTQGRFCGILGLSFDITALKQAQRAKQAMEQAKEEFFLNMAHDIRTPLAAIIGTLEILDEEEDNPGKKERLKDCLQASYQLLDFMHDAQEMAQERLALNYKPCDMCALLDGVTLLFGAAVKMKALAIETHCTVGRVVTDRFRIQKILINLLGNAIKYTLQGKVVISITAGTSLTISVSDSGIGIDEVHQDRVFEEYFRIVPSYQEQNYSGIGKGLYLVKKYVDDLQGKVTLKSKLNEGSTFTVEIPLDCLRNTVCYT